MRTCGGCGGKQFFYVVHFPPIIEAGNSMNVCRRFWEDDEARTLSARPSD